MHLSCIFVTFSKCFYFSTVFFYIISKKRTAGILPCSPFSPITLLFVLCFPYFPGFNFLKLLEQIWQCNLCPTVLRHIFAHKVTVFILLQHLPAVAPDPPAVQRIKSAAFLHDISQPIADERFLEPGPRHMNCLSGRFIIFPVRKDLGHLMQADFPAALVYQNCQQFFCFRIWKINLFPPIIQVKSPKCFNVNLFCVP